jgi:hypothetical protein
MKPVIPRRCNARLRPGRKRFAKPRTPSKVIRLRGPRCRMWAMANGRCRFHGGLSTGARTGEGKTASVAAMARGRRAWIECTRAEADVRSTGALFPMGRRRGAEWVTDRMRENARAEALVLLASLGDKSVLTGWTPSYAALDDKPLVMALLRSAKLRARGTVEQRPPSPGDRPDAETGTRASAAKRRRPDARRRALVLLRAAAAQPAEPLSHDRLVAVAKRRLRELRLPIR